MWGFPLLPVVVVSGKLVDGFFCPPTILQFPISAEDERALKYESERCLTVLGFCHMNAIPRTFGCAGLAVASSPLPPLVSRVRGTFGQTAGEAPVAALALACVA
jgi:hypothetical protein